MNNIFTISKTMKILKLIGKKRSVRLELKTRSQKDCKLVSQN